MQIAASDGSLSLNDVLAVVGQAMFYAGVVGLIGALAFRVLVLAALARAGEFPEVVRLVVGRTWVTAKISAWAVLFAAPTRLMVEARTLLPDDFSGALVVATTETAWAAGWWLHVGGGLLAAAGLAMARPLGKRTVGWAVAAVGILLLPLAVAVSGHAWTAQPRSLAVVSLYLHVIAAAAWVGGLYCVLVAGLPAWLVREGTVSNGFTFVGTFHGLPAMMGAFSRIAVVAVSIVLVTGTTNVWLQLDAFSQLWTTAWGQTLLIKLVPATATMCLCFYNWRMVHPRLAGDKRMRLLKGPVTMEVALAGGALVVTSWLMIQSL